MDVTTQAIALRSTDINENDKLILLYSLKYGKITVHAKGIRKSTAKLKFCADQFCFGDYELIKSGDDRFTLKTCSQSESFFCLREDVERYYAACCIAECVIVGTEEGQSEPPLFVEMLRALGALANETEPLIATLRFMQEFLRLEGSALDWDVCSACGNKPQRVFLDAYRGSIVCENCQTADSVAVSPRVVALCKMIDGLPYDKLKNVTATGEILKQGLTVFGKHFARAFAPLRSLPELVRL